MTAGSDSSSVVTSSSSRESLAVAGLLSAGPSPRCHPSTKDGALNRAPTAVKAHVRVSVGVPGQVLADTTVAMPAVPVAMTGHRSINRRHTKSRFRGSPNTRRCLAVRSSMAWTMARVSPAHSFCGLSECSHALNLTTRSGRVYVLPFRLYSRASTSALWIRSMSALLPEPHSP